ncbi:MAG: DUF4968 domain-containing protein, partial [Muribaculaceae bacterium]|nr:DUF4968 domain-containing protein [Muribaculaceae bacterium]
MTATWNYDANPSAIPEGHTAGNTGVALSLSYLYFYFLLNTLPMKRLFPATMAGTLAVMACGAAIAGQSGIKETDGSYDVETAKGVVSILPLNNDIFRVTTRPSESKLNYQPSQSAVMKRANPDVKAISSPEAFFISSPTTTVRIDRESGKVTFHNAAGDIILSEIAGVDNSGNVKTVTFEGDADETIYGAGERGHSLNLNGDTLVMFNRQNYGYTAGDPRISQMGITAPYFASDLGYGVLFDDYNASALHLGDRITYTSD